MTRHRLTPTGGAALTIAMIGLWTAVGGEGPISSAGAILVLLALLVLIVVGIAWPTIAVRRVTVSARTPSDALVGDTVGLVVEVGGDVTGVELRVLDPAGPWHRAPDGVEVEVDHVADRRGVFDHVVFEVRTSAPLGMFAVHRLHVCAMPTPVWVAPVPLQVDWKPGAAPAEGIAQSGGATALAGDVVRSVRPYAVGDPMRLVHWRTSARTGELVVRELDPPSPVGQVVVLDLTDLGPQVDQAAAYALGACFAVLDAGGALVLCTREVDGPVVADVGNHLVARRRIAAAVPGEPAPAPTGWPLVEIGR